MSTTDNQPINNNSFFSTRPWVAVIAPLSVVAGIAAVAVVFAVVRRRNKRRRGGFVLTRQARLALERDVLDDGTGNAYPPPFNNSSNNNSSRVYYYGDDDLPGRNGGTLPPYYRRRPPRTINRWAWANTINLATFGGFGNRREEGLNEFGEAPPPYEVPANQAKAPEGEQPPQSSVRPASALSMPPPPPPQPPRSPPPAHALSGRERETSAPSANPEDPEQPRLGASQPASTLPSLPPPYSEGARTAGPPPQAAGGEAHPRQTSQN